MSTRRNFLKQSALLAASVAITPTLASAAIKKKAIGIQLWSVRDLIDKDLSNVIGKIAQIGYKEVETFDYSKKNGFWGLNAKEFNNVLRQNGLKSPSGHFNLDSYLQDKKTDQLKDYIEAANILGSEYIIIPSLPSSLTKTADGYKKAAEKLNEAAITCKTAGLKIAYHNHNSEFKKFEDTTGYDILLKETDKKLVDFELDLYWANYAKQDVIKIFEAHPGRFKLWHIKDMDKTNYNLNTEIGKGLVNFKPIFAAAKLAGVKYYVVEHESNYKPDELGSIKDSFHYVNDQLL